MINQIGIGKEDVSFMSCFQKDFSFYELSLEQSSTSTRIIHDDVF